MKLHRHQLEAHLALHGWVPARNVEKSRYLLRNSDVLVLYSPVLCEWQPDDPGTPPYYLNDRWPLCAWADIPDTPLRRMAEHIEKSTS